MALKKINEIAKIAGIPEKYVEPYGFYKAKISMDYYQKIKKNPTGKLVLVTAITPTKAGEGKTTTSIALTEGLGKIKQNKLLFKSSTGEYEKEKGTSDFKKNDIRLDIEPKILTEEEKEDFLKLKEQKIRDKETKIQNDIKEAEKAKEEEEERFKKLTEEMKIIPCKLEDIYIYVKTEIIMDEQLLLY